MYFLHSNQIRCYLLTLYSLICPRSPLPPKFDTQKINISSLSHYKANRIRTQHLEVFDSSQSILIPKQCLAEGNSSLYFYNISNQRQINKTNSLPLLSSLPLTLMFPLMEPRIREFSRSIYPNSYFIFFILLFK